MLFKCPSHVSRANPVSPPMITVVSFWERVVVTSPETLHCTAQTQLKRSVCLPEKLHPSVCCFSSHAGCPADYHHLRNLCQIYSSPVGKLVGCIQHEVRAPSRQGFPHIKTRDASQSVAAWGWGGSVITCSTVTMLTCWCLSCVYRLHDLSLVC